MKQFPFPVDAKVPLYLAPMAGVSESPFRRLCARFGADVVITEFLSAEGIRRENEARILEAAERVFAETGLAGATMAQICQAANLP